MPELPEVETTKRYLEKKIVGQRIKKIKILSPKQFIGNPKQIIGKKIIGLQRRAKILIWQLEGDCWLLIHLKLTGQIVYTEKLEAGKAVFGHPIPLAGGPTLPGKSTRIIIYLSQGTVFFNDLRKFGWIKIIQNPRPEDNRPLAEKSKIQKSELNKILESLGIEPLSKEFSPQYLQKILAKSRRAVKLVLMDQSKIAGLGNIYANEALWRAKIDPRKPANQVKRVKQLWQAIRTVLKEGIKYGGTSAADEAYIKPNGNPGNYQQHLAVYQRQNQPCPRCGKPIIRIKVDNRSTFFCSRCQQ